MEVVLYVVVGERMSESETDKALALEQAVGVTKMEVVYV